MYYWFIYVYDTVLHKRAKIHPTRSYILVRKTKWNKKLDGLEPSRVKKKMPE